MSKPLCPCKGCTGRCVGCHGSCQRYADYRAEIAEAKAAKIKANNVRIYDRDSRTRHLSAVYHGHRGTNGKGVWWRIH